MIEMGSEIIQRSLTSSERTEEQRQKQITHVLDLVQGWETKLADPEWKGNRDEGERQIDGLNDRLLSLGYEPEPPREVQTENFEFLS